MESDTCAICDNLFDDPKILPCLHSFCSKCIAPLNEDNSVTCPTCSHQSLISPDHGDTSVQSELQSNTWLREISRINGLIREISQSPSNSAFCASCGENNPSTSYCIECNGCLCTRCLKAHSKVKDLRSHVILQLNEIKAMVDDSNKVKAVLLNTAKNPVCLSHEELKLDLYCNTCESLVCAKCSITTHKGHSITELTEQAGETQSKLQKNVQEISSKYENLQKSIHSGNEVQEEIRQVKKRKVDVIEQAFSKLHQALDQRKETLLTEASQLCTAKDVQIAMQLESLEKLLQSIKEFETLSSNVTSGDYGFAHFMSIADTLNKRAIYLKEQVTVLGCGDEFVAPAISVEVNQDGLVSFINEFGSVSDKCPASCSTVVIPRRKVAIGVEMKVRVISLDVNKNPMCKGGAKVRGTLRCPITNSSSSCPVVDCNDGTYIVSVVQQQLGDHQLTITINSQTIEGSPFNLTAVKPVDYTKITRPVYEIDCDWTPNFIAFSENVDMFATSESANKIYVYDSNNHIKSSFGSKGTGNLQFEILNGIAISGEVIYVTDYSGNRIQKITTGGEFLGSFGEKGSDVGQFNQLWGATVGPDGNLYVADCINNRVQVFSSDWEMPNDSVCHVTSIEVEHPIAIDFDLDNNIHVSSSDGPIRVYSPSGKFIRQYSDKNKSHRGIAIDSSGQSLVADYKNKRLLVYSPSGALVHSINGLSGPYGVSISPSDGSVWVADNGSKKLLKYTIVEVD